MFTDVVAAAAEVMMSLPAPIPMLPEVVAVVMATMSLPSYEEIWHLSDSMVLASVSLPDVPTSAGSAKRCFGVSQGLCKEKGYGRILLIDPLRRK